MGLQFGIRDTSSLLGISQDDPPMKRIKGEGHRQLNFNYKGQSEALQISTSLSTSSTTFTQLIESHSLSL